MLVDLKTLKQDLPVVDLGGVPHLCETIASLGFPVDGVEHKDGTTVLDVDVTANRGDVMSHWGLARDIGARMGIWMRWADAPELPEGEMLRTITIEAEACRIYATALIMLGPEGGTPKEVMAFLAAIGAGGKGLPAVDASNEILHRYGQPTHAFDADKLKGAISVRWAKAGETLTTLDGVARKLTAEDLVIADESGPVSLAGVMGGDPTKVTADTRRVLLESAWFDPRTVRLMARRHNLHTDGSHRFGRGADPAMAKIARDLFVARLKAWTGASLLGAWSVGAAPQPEGAIALWDRDLHRIAGEAIPTSEAVQLLRNLGFAVSPFPDGGLYAQPPSWRHDINLMEDLAEEILRLRGYDHIPLGLPHVDAEPEPLSPGYLQRQRLARRLAHLGFHQTVTYGFLGPEEDAPFADTPAEGRTLGNPLGLEYSVLRSSLLPSLKAAALHNLRQGQKQVRLFEIAPAYASSPEGPRSTLKLALVWAGQLGGEDFLTKARAVQPADLLGIAQDLGGRVEVRDLGEGILAWELALEALPLPQDRVIPPFKPFSRHPVVERDLSLLVALSQSHAELAAAMRAALPAECTDLRCVDVFRHKSLPEGRQAWLMRCVFQADRTLTSEEVDGWMKSALAAAESLGATLRG